VGCRCDICRHSATEDSREYRTLHAEEHKEFAHNHYVANRKRYKETARDYVKLNRDKIRVAKRIYQRNKWHSDPKYRIRCLSGHRIRQALRGIAKSASTVELIGCSIAELRKHLESQFKLGMVWDNYGEWHIDHIRPCSSFDLMDTEQQKICFNWKNLQPLWAKENLIKGDKVA
jgi:hypothetical protein